MEATAYMYWLAREGNRDRNRISVMIQMDFMEKGEMALGLLEATGDKKYNEETFLKASDIVISATGTR